MTRAQRQQARRNAQRQRRAHHQRQLQRHSAVNRKRRQRRNAEAFGLKGATEFSCDPVLSDPVAVVELFKRFAAAACLELISATTPHRPDNQAGAPRMDGSWALVFLAHIMSGDPDWQHWYHRNTDPRLWRACGFEQVPSFQTLYLRFAELEDPRYVAAFERAAYRFVRIAARNVPHAFDFVHIDGTPAHSHARLTHACPSEHFCRTRTGSAAKQLDRASDDAISSDRHERSAAPEPEDPDAPPDNRLFKLTDDEAVALGLPDRARSQYFKFGANGHIMRSRDRDVGVRMYSAGPRSKKKVWLGGYFLPAISDYFWAPFALHFFPADVQEHLGWPVLHRKAMTALNDDPDNPTHRITGVVADRAFTNKTFIAFNTHEGIASITPERTLPGGRAWETLRDVDGRWDEHGPRCRYCGGPAAPARGAGEGFAITGAGDPRLSYRCHIGWTTDCQTKLQTISCKREYRALLPIARTERVFHDLLASHGHFEGVFDSWRDRYGVSGTSNATRSKRRGSIAAQRLRGAAALLAEWFRICLRMGYVGNHAKRNRNQPERRTAGARRLIKVREYRDRHGLHLPVGPRAQALGLTTAGTPNAPPPAPPP
jgi:hypothetical protein